MASQRVDHLRQRIAVLDVTLRDCTVLLARQRRRSRLAGLGLSLVLVLLVLVASVKIKGSDLEIWPAGATNPLPSYKLTLIGTNSSGTQRGMSLHNAATGPSTYRLAISDHAGTERVSITDAGKVGIGTSTPSYLLDVAGTARITGEVALTSREVSFFAYNNSHLNITTTNATQVLFAAEFHDDGGNYDTGTSTFRAPVEGVYHFSVQVRTFRLDEEQSAILYLYKNGASMVLLHLSRLGHADGAVYDLKDRTFSGTATVKLAAGDRITVMMSSTDSSYSTWGYPHFSASFTNFSGHRVH